MSEPFVNGEDIKNLADHCFWSDIHHPTGGDMSFSGGDIVFCKIDKVLDFFEKIRLTRKRIILITGEGDLPCDSFRQKFLPHNIFHWFATNVTHTHPRVTALPLGLGAMGDPVTLSWQQIIAGKKMGLTRERWLYVNFRPETNPAVRQPIHDYLKRASSIEPWITMEEAAGCGANQGYLKNLLTHRFVLCPPGNGIDTHRLWESLAAGAVPIVIKTPAMKPFQDLPIMFVDKYEDVSEKMLEKTWNTILGCSYKDEKLKEKYWENLIKNMQRQVKPDINILYWFLLTARYGFGFIARKINFKKWL